MAMTLAIVTVGLFLPMGPLAHYFKLQALPPLRIHTTPYPLQAAQQAMDDLRAGRFQGAAVLLAE